ncbi:uncharacterized protein LOC129779682 [Toxorhynchites rutilus septentrionalis]|uniref:uncharacterized protein LOC129779682 n=1 Tax=Toxorhynchites rutilus septentrionalis TaxID=329112 RepID=UPI002479B867|nr:uncharacterized protein LOC129779682 [Toxorhynchites rutilus septentrionalis]
MYLAHAVAIRTMFDQIDDIDCVMVLGDYNLPYLRWQFDEDLNRYTPINASSEQELTLIESLLVCGLTQTNRFTNANQRPLDLAFINAPDDMETIEPSQPLLSVDHHHKPFIVLLDIRSSELHSHTEQQTVMTAVNFRRCNFESLNNAIASIEWQLYLVGNSIDSVVSSFYAKLSEVLDMYVPRVRRKPYVSMRKPWWTADLRHMRNVLRKARKRYFKTRTMADCITLRSIEISYTDLLAESHRTYMYRVQQNLKQNPTFSLKYIRLLRGNTRIPPNMEFNGKISSSFSEAANLLANFFQSVFSCIQDAFSISQRTTSIFL